MSAQTLYNIPIKNPLCMESAAVKDNKKMRNSEKRKIYEDNNKWIIPLGVNFNGESMVGYQIYIQNDHRYIMFIYLYQKHRQSFPSGEWTKSWRPVGFPLDRYIDHVRA